MKNNSVYTTSKSNKGFSLVELIVVIAIMVVLVAVIAPSFTKYIAEARSATCTQNRDTLQRELLAAYTDDTSLFSDGTITSDELANAGFSTQELCPDHGTISAELENGSFKIYCSIHDSPISFGNKNSIASMMKIINSYCSANIDSGATEFPDSNSSKTMNAMKEAGFDFEKLGAVSWRYARSDNMFYWSTQDISSMNKGDVVPVIRYNPETGTYTVWNATISEGTTATGTHPYNILSSFKNYTPSTNSPKDSQTYENALKYYEEALGKSSAN